MKNLFTIAFFLSISFYSFGQEKDMKLSDLKTPNSPGFQLLDISPSSIERPTNPKEFSLKFLNLFNNGNAIPKNFALEISPFWYFKKKNESVYKYLGVGEKTPETEKLGAQWSTGVLRKANISLASTFSDSTAGSLLKNTNYVSFGFRTNLFTFRTSKQNETINKALLDAAKRQDRIINDALHNGNSLNEAEKKLDSDKSYNEAIKIAEKLPLLQFDAAFAYSDAFSDNSFNNRRFNRWALWGSFAINADFKSEKQDNHSLSFIFLAKALRDNVLKDTSNKIFTEANSFDFGGKLEYSINRLTLSIEYINRNYNDMKSINSERTVALIQYKISDNLYATGTYGKNFGNFNNVFSLLGLNWGFGNSKLSTSK
ncbi:MAG: hypothetical protein IM449_16930 [Microcystis sp. M065S1]|nr:hypothetical protein [Microcystis sp. M065S1]